MINSSVVKALTVREAIEITRRGQSEQEKVEFR